MRDKDVLDFVARLAGKPIARDEFFSLSSARKAQLASWLRREGVAFDYDVIDRPTMTIAAILGEGGAAAAVTTPAEPAPAIPRAPAPALSGIGLRVGIDIEAVANLPEAEDYRAHPFYRDNFTPQELAHCLIRGDERSSLSGLWAAKEAIVKAGGATPSAKGKLGGIEIGHDDAGRPTFPGCDISISHEAGLAVAVCISFGAGAP